MLKIRVLFLKTIPGFINFKKYLKDYAKRKTKVWIKQ